MVIQNAWRTLTTAKNRIDRKGEREEESEKERWVKEQED